MSSLIQCLGTWLNDDAGIAVLERKLADAKSAAATAIAKLHAAEAALTLTDFQTALATARATRAA